MEAGWAWEEMAGARLWDGRCRRSLVAISERLGQQPGVSLSARDPAQLGKRRTRRQRVTAEKESQKWLDGLQATEAALPPTQKVLLVADREADVFAYLAAPRRSHTDLLIRASSPRTAIVA